MLGPVFIINHRFIVNSDRNEVSDKETGLSNRLEPRLMKLLCVLAEQQGKVVKREAIIKRIWDDYPGASEGLNQAVSFLRKLLNDEDKKIIQTQPKAGYCFNAIIDEESESKQRSKIKYLPVIIGAALLLLIGLMVDIYLRKGGSGISDRQSDERNAAQIARLDSIHQAEQMKKYVKDTLGKAARGDSMR